MHLSLFFRRSFVFLALLVSLFLPRVQAGLITPGYEAQLESWIGQGNLNFVNIFTKAPGETGTSLHAAVDGRGPTITIMTVSGAGFSNQVIGGYNPLSMNSGGNWNISPPFTEKTHFIFNLSISMVQREFLSQNAFSFNNHPHLIYFNRDLEVHTFLHEGHALQTNYGLGTHSTDILNRPTGTSSNYGHFTIDSLEVYAVGGGSSSVPETASTVGLMAVAFAGLLALRRRSNRG